MYTSDDILRIKKPECAIWVVVFEETDLMETFCSPPRFEAQVSAKPPHPEDVDLLRLGVTLSWVIVAHKDMEDSDYSCIPVWMWIPLFILVREHHDVCMRAGIDGVLVTTAIVRRVVDTQSFVVVDAIVDKAKLLSLGSCKILVIYTLCIWRYVKKNVVLESWDKLLWKDHDSLL